MKTPYEIAQSEYGIKEIPGGKDNPEILKYFDEMGFDSKLLHDETAWCSAFVNYCCKIAEKDFSGKLNARSWLEIGEEVKTPEQGDIVILWRESPDSWKGHVGFYVTDRKGWTFILGGNQGNAVKIQAYPTARILKYVRV
jgi:uncharacterized protein (TIGR02594 family)